MSGDIQKCMITLVGDAEVGKSCLSQMFIKGSYPDSNYISTIGINFFKTTIQDVRFKPIEFGLWDTSGQERYQTLSPMYVRSSPVCIIAFDLTNAVSFSHVRSWQEKVLANNAEANIILVGTKADLKDERQVSEEAIESLSNELNLKYIETSAKENKNVTSLFLTAASLMSDKQKKQADQIPNYLGEIIKSVIQEAKKSLQELQASSNSPGRETLNISSNNSSDEGVQSSLRIIHKYYGSILNELERNNNVTQNLEKIKNPSKDIQKAFKKIKKTSKGRYLLENFGCTLGAVFLAFTGIGLGITILLGVNNTVKRGNPCSFFDTDYHIAKRAEQRVKTSVQMVSEMGGMSILALNPL